MHSLYRMSIIKNGLCFTFIKKCEKFFMLLKNYWQTDIPIIGIVRF